MVWGKGGGGGLLLHTVLFLLPDVCTLVYLLRDFSLGGGGGNIKILVSDSISGQDIGICIVCFGLLCSCVCFRILMLYLYILRITLRLI